MTAVRRALALAVRWAAALLDRLDPPYGQHAPMVPAAASADSGGGPAPARHAPPWQPAAAPSATPARPAPSPARFGEGAPRVIAADPTYPGDPDDPGHPFAPVTVAFPDGHATILDAGGQWRIKPLAFDGRCRETGAQAALTRPAYERYEAWRDAPAMATDANDTLCPRCRNFWFNCTCKGVSTP